ncbi:MAG: 50S ribosomal protein L4 [Candidatus Levyibacteriota bacterium]
MEKKTIKKTVAKKAVSKAVTAKTAKPVVKKAAVKEVAAPVKAVKAEAKNISVEVVGLDGNKAGTITLPGEIFNAKVNPVLMAQAVRVYLANQRVGTASTKTRGEVSGTTKKIYRQKGTGRARHGAAKAPIFVGGGISFGPRPRSFSLAMPKKMKRSALFSALTAKLADKKVLVVDFAAATGKTKEVAKALKALNLTDKNGDAKNVLLVVNKEQTAVKRSARNIKGVAVQASGNINAYEVLKGNTVVLMKESIDVIKDTFLT